MSYTIKITYKGVETEASKIVSPICRIYRPDSSYVDTQVYTQGGPITADGQPVAAIGDVDPNYGKSIYATNVDGFGTVPSPEPFATTSVPFPVPLAQFKLAMVSAEKDDDGNPYVEFDVADYKEAFYYSQVGVALVDQRFEVTVTKN